MPGVTLTGGAGETVTLPFPPGPNAVLAQYLADNLTMSVASGALKAVDYTGQPLPTVTGDEEVVIKANGPLFLPETTKAVVDAAHFSVLFGSGAAGETVLSGSGNLTYFTNGGSGTLVAGDGRTRVVQTGNGPWDIHTGNGNDQILISGGANTISAGGGHNSILLSGGDNLVTSSGDDHIAAVTGADTIVATGNQPVHVQGIAADITFIGGDGPATVVGGMGSETVFASAGGYFRGGSEGHNLIYGGDGPTTIAGGGDGDQLYAMGSHRTEITAAGGNETLNAALSSGNDVLRAGSGQDQVIGGFGNDTLAGGSGAATMTGGAGADVFSFIKGEGSHATIADFSAAEGDKVHLVGFSHGDLHRALEHAHVGKAGVTITLGDDTKITFANITDISKVNFN